MSKTKKETKIWGTVIHSRPTDDIMVTHLDVNKGFRCSKHKHEHRFNHFIVISGRLFIEAWLSGPMKEPTKILVGPGEEVTVAPNTFHRFLVEESGKVIEVYWSKKPDLSFEDIVRLDVGGKIED